MREPYNDDEAPYWTEDIGLFEGTFRYTHDKPRTVRVRVHVSDEPYRLDAGDCEIVPVLHHTGTRIYLHFQSYILVPDIRLTVAFFPLSQQNGAIGRALAAEERSRRRQAVGHGQAWYYPADRTMVIWEAFLEAPFRDVPLEQDANMRRLWLGLEDYLTTRFPDAARLITPFDDPLFETGEYRTFLVSLGYAPVAKAAYGKAVYELR